MREVERPADADDLGWVQQVAGTPNSGRGGYLSLRDLFVGPDLLSALAAAGELNVYDHVAGTRNLRLSRTSPISPPHR